MNQYHKKLIRFYFGSLEAEGIAYLEEPGFYYVVRITKLINRSEPGWDVGEFPDIIKRIKDAPPAKHWTKGAWRIPIKIGIELLPQPIGYLL